MTVPLDVVVPTFQKLTSDEIVKIAELLAPIFDANEWKYCLSGGDYRVPSAAELADKINELQASLLMYPWIRSGRLLLCVDTRRKAQVCLEIDPKDIVAHDECVREAKYGA